MNLRRVIRVRVGSSWSQVRETLECWSAFLLFCFVLFFFVYVRRVWSGDVNICGCIFDGQDVERINEGMYSFVIYG